MPQVTVIVLLQVIIAVIVSGTPRLGVAAEPEDQVLFSAETVDVWKTRHIITEELSTYAEQVRARQGVHGLALGVVRPDGGIEFGAWGNSTEDGHPVDADVHHFCHRLVHEGISCRLFGYLDHGRNETALPHSHTTFGWHTKVKDMLPNEWQINEKWAEQMMDLRDILSHVSGRVGHDLSYKSRDSMQDAVYRLRYHNSPFELRQTYAYHNEMYVMSTYILTRYSGKAFSTFANDRIFKPLGMNSTVMSPAAATAKGDFSQVWSSRGRRIPYWFSEESHHLVGGAGAILSTARDMAKWLQLLLNNGVHPASNVTVIPKSVTDAVTTASAVYKGTRVANTMSIMGYGMGWGRYSYRGQDVVVHPGGMPGFMSLVEFLLHTKLGIVLLTNTDEGDIVNKFIAARVLEDVVGLNHSELPARRGSEMKNTRKLSFNIPPSVPLELYAGTYHRPGYGNLTFCTPSGDENAARTGKGLDAYCSSLRKKFSVVDDAHGVPRSKLQLFAAYNCIWGKQVCLTHLKYDTFDFALTTLFTNGFGTDTRPFEYEFDETKGATARFIIEDTITDGGVVHPCVKGFFACGILRDADEVQGDCMTGEGAQPNSLVWFEKVS